MTGYAQHEKELMEAIRKVRGLSEPVVGSAGAWDDVIEAINAMSDVEIRRGAKPERRCAGTVREVRSIPEWLENGRFPECLIVLGKLWWSDLPQGCDWWDGIYCRIVRARDEA